MTAQHVFHKADSLRVIAGAGREVTATLRGRIAALQDLLPTLDLDAYRREILARACAALLEAEDADESEFRLRPHIISELERITDNELPRYLFYRYRYDVFPLTHELDAYPPCVQIEPTSICNYRCVFCYQTDRAFTQGRSGHMGQMPLATFKRIVDEIEGHVEAVTLASRGEPLLCKQIDQMLDYMRGKFLALKINTNAWYLDEAKCHAILAAEPNTLVFSADAADPELYARLRVNGKLERVLENVRRFAEIRARHYPASRTITRVSGVRYSPEQDFGEVERFWHDYVDQVAFVDYNPWENAYEMPANGISAPCSDLWRRAFVWWDGQMNPCDVDYKSSLSAGRIGERSLSDLWRGEAYGRLRQAHLDGRRQDVSPCRGCVVV
ncbi:MAG TPA: radical SAM protein [Xanthobacteraceae bacterium]|nr:radical SAM protein [Xanthobacteraceae bacterium]